MADDSGQIKSHIDSARRELNGNLHELESSMKEATQWRTYVNKYPLKMVAGAFAGGALISILLGPSRDRSERRYRQAQTFGNSGFKRHGAEYQRHQAAEVLDNIKGALIGLAAAQIKEFFYDAIPGFRQQYDRTERQQKSSPTVPLIH